MNSKSIPIGNCILQIAVMLLANTFAWGQTSKVSEPKEYKDTNTVSINFNKNVELFGYMVHLAEPEVNDPSHPVSIELSKWPNDLNNPSLGKVYELAGNISYAFFIDLFFHLSDFPLSEGYHLPHEVLDRYGYTTTEEINMVKTLINRANEFSQNSNFEELWSNLEPQRAKTLETLQASIESQNFSEILSEMEGFYQQDFSNYQIVPSLTLWSGPGWGFKDQNDREKTAIFILGPLNRNFDYSDTTKFKTLSIHEFGHSFVNHVLLQNVSDIISETEDLYLPLKEGMTPQGYPNWESCIIEHFVRAGEVLIPELMGNKTLSQSNLDLNTAERKFIYLPFIVDRLRHYRLDKGISYKESLISTMIDVKERFR